VPISQVFCEKWDFPIGLTSVTFIHAENQKPGDLAEPARTAAITQLQAAAQNRFIAALDLIV
jgi:hypothetical protein